MNNGNSGPAKALIYLRAARVKREVQAAIDAQRQACERRAAELGLRVVDEYVDYGSAHTLDQRPGLQRMLGDLKAYGDVACVITHDHTRIARNTYIYTQVVWAIEEAGARLEIASLEPDQPVQTSITDIAARQHRSFADGEHNNGSHEKGS